MKYLIVAHGAFLPKSIILEAAENACIIALDDAANQLVHLGIIPHIILGDFDFGKNAEKTMDFWGIHQDIHGIEKMEIKDLFLKPYKGHHDVTIVPAPNQNFTDLQKALFFSMHDADQYHFPLATSVHIVCAMSGRMDHEQAAIRTLQNAFTKNCPVYLHNEYQSAWMASNETIIIQGKHHDHCGLFGAPQATMLVKNSGLEYGSEEPYILSSQQYSSSNRIIGNNNAIVEITGTALIISPPMLETQRIFMQLSRSEQLEILLHEQFIISTKP